MAGKTFDGVIEAVRYTPDGKIDLVRAYERRGGAFSDVLLLRRGELLERLQKGRKFVTGFRREFMAGTFEAGKDLQLSGAEGNQVISAGAANGRESLEGVPVF